MSGQLNDRQLFDWLRLIRSENVGPRTFLTLINRFGGASAALDALPDLAAQRGRVLKIAAVEDIERELEAAARLGVRYLALGDPDYPALLRKVDAPPPLLAMRGQAGALNRPAVAMVGSRNASAAGLAFTERVARGLAQADYVVVSGLARGIDARAHQATLATGTIAVLAGGHDRLYPADHGPLLNHILEHGAALSEMPMGWEPRGRDFPRRNRIVAGLAMGVVVVEAALQTLYFLDLKADTITSCCGQVFGEGKPDLGGDLAHPRRHLRASFQGDLRCDGGGEEFGDVAGGKAGAAGSVVNG